MRKTGKEIRGEYCL